MEKMDGGSFYVMPDGRIVSLSETAMDMIAEMGEVEEGKEEEEGEGMLKIQGEDEPTGLLSESEANFDFDAEVETIITYRCRSCEFTSQSRTLVREHVREVHLYIKAIQEAKVLVSDDVEPVGGDEEVDVNPEQSVNGMRIIVNDQLEDEVGGGIVEDGLSSVVQGSGLPFESSHFSIIIGKDVFSGDGTMAAGDVVSVLAEKPVSLDPTPSPKKQIAKAETGKKLQSNELEANHEKRQLVCSFKNCSFIFKEQEQLDYHLNCHQEEGGGFCCPEVGCEVRSEKWREMATHLWRRHSRDCDMLLCGLCTNYRTMYPKILEAHHQTHMNLKQFVCDVCHKGFNQMSQLKNHAVIHLDKSGIEPIPSWAKPKQCDICQKMFSDSKCLKKHVQAIHSKLKPYICQVCGHQSARKAMLQLHVRQHTGEKPFQCDACEYRTGDHNSLRRHKRKHTGDKPYKCPHCDYASIQSSSFKSHLRSKHPEQVEVRRSLPCPLLLVELEQQDDLSQIVVVKEEGPKN